MREFPFSSTLLFVSMAIAIPVAAEAASDPFFSRWETFGEADGLPSEKVTAVAIDGNRIWVGTDAGLALLENGRIEVTGVEDGLPFPVVSALAVDRTTGDLWIGTQGGLARLSAGRIDRFTQLDSGLANDVVYGVAARDGVVWVATAAGLNSYSAATDSWEIFDVSNTLMHEPWCYAVTFGGEDVYVAVWGGGVIVREHDTGRFREHRDPDGEMEIDLFPDDGLVHDVTSSIAWKDGVMWAGTYFGLSRYEGRRWKSFSRHDSGLASDFINFVQTGDDEVWIATDRGLSRFDSIDWHTWTRRDAGAFELEVTKADGTEETVTVAGGPASNYILGLAVDGRDIWLATAAGLTHGVGHRAERRSAAPQSEHKTGAPQ